MRRLIKTDGTAIDMPQPLTIDQACKLIDADTLDSVVLKHLGEPLHVMLVDDVGYESRAITDGNATLLVPVKARKPANRAATALYHANCQPGTTHRIVGDVYVCPDADFAP